MRCPSPHLPPGKSRSVANSAAEAMMPDACGADQVGVRTQRGQSQFRFFERHESASLVYGLPNATEKKACALHHAAAENNRVRHKKIDQIGQTKTQKVSFAISRSASQFVSLLRKLADLLRGKLSGIAVVRGCVHFEPCNHRRTRRQRFPAPAKPASAQGAGRV